MHTKGDKVCSKFDLLKAGRAVANNSVFWEVAPLAQCTEINGGFSMFSCDSWDSKQACPR